MNSELFPRPRAVRSRRLDIRAEIYRRMASGESLAIRQIIHAVGGGSTDTVSQELAALSSGDAKVAEALKGHRLRNRDEERMALRSALDASLEREAALRAENQGLRQIVEQTGSTMSYLVARHDDVFRMLMTSIDEYRDKKAAADAVLTNPPTTVTKEVFIEDPLLEARYKVKIRELADAHRQINQLQAELQKFLPPPPPPPEAKSEDPDEESAYE